MPEIKERLEETAKTCLKAYEDWRGDEKKQAARESLQDAIHELRKVTSRLEIEVAISERDQNAAKPLPIPPHRSQNRKAQGAEDNDSQQVTMEQKPQRRRPPRKKAEG